MVSLISFTIKDLVGAITALFLFPFVLLFPGYVIGWWADLFNFRKRQFLVKYVIALPLSLAVQPIVIYLLYYFYSFDLVKIEIFLFFVLYFFIIFSDIKRVALGRAVIQLGRYQKAAIMLAVIWGGVSLVSLVDIQWGENLYYSVVSLDFATRVSMVDAITRTGVPPVNPGYFPGQPEYVTSLYYFWYILCSVIDQIGMDLVDARTSLIAGDVWCGLSIMAIIALYLRIRNRRNSVAPWKSAVTGICFLSISGIDIIPAVINMFMTRFLFGGILPMGDIEHWNEQITAWVGSLLWVPHHVAALIVCLLSFLLFQYFFHKSSSPKIMVFILTSCCLASSAGLSTWVSITFLIFWCVWGMILFIQKNYKHMIFMISSGLFSLFLASPLLLGMLSGGTGADGLPIVLDVRKFRPLLLLFESYPDVFESLVHLVFLPVNYSLELGFFLVAGVMWVRQYLRGELKGAEFAKAETVMLAVVFFVGSFLRSAIYTNDLGWRSWLLGQFVLLIWAVDVVDIKNLLSKNNKFLPSSYSMFTRKILRVVLILGFSTSILNIILLRIWTPLIDAGIVGFPNGISDDRKLGERTYAARLTYEFIGSELPLEVVIQQRPSLSIDRPSGLYGLRQFAISSNTAYNVSMFTLSSSVEKITKIFDLANDVDWGTIDLFCKKNFIDILIVNKQDRLWNSLPLLYEHRRPLYKNQYYSVILCGDFVNGI